MANSILVQAFYVPDDGNSLRVRDTQSGIDSNLYEARTGAARYGISRFLVNKADLSSVGATVGRMTGTLGLSVPIPKTKVGASIKLTQRATVPVISAGGDVSTNLDNDIVEVVAFDDRHKGDNVELIDQSFNMWSPATQAFDKATMKSGGTVEWTWAEVCTQLKISHQPGIFPNFKPRNLSFQNMPLSRAIDIIAGRTFTVAGYNPGTGLVKLYAPWVPGESETNETLWSKASRYVLNDGETTRSKTAIPGNIKVVFRKLNQNPADQYSDRYYEVTNEDVNNAGGTSDELVLQVSSWFWTSADDEAELTTIADELSTAAFIFLNQDIVSYKLPGFWPFELDGLWRNIKYQFDHRGSFTIISQSNVCDFEFNGSNAANGFSYNYEFLGLGNSQVMSEPGGERMIYDTPDPPSSQAVQWAKTTADWVDNPDNGCYILANPCDNADGDNPDATITYTVALPRSGQRMDPNLRLNAVIAIARTNDLNWQAGTEDAWICVSDYLDDEIGQFRVWYDATSIPAGWQLADGTNGTEDLRSRFIVGYDDRDIDYIAAEPGDHSVGGFKWHGQTENNHADHDLTHTHFAGSYYYVQYCATGLYVWAQGASAGATWTGAANLPISQPPDANSLAKHYGPYYDILTGAPYDDTDNRAPFITVAWIQRID